MSSDSCFTPETSGCYCLIAESIFGCITSLCDTILLDGIHEINNIGVTVFPIPSNGHWNIQFSADVQLPIVWELFEIYGKSIEYGDFQHLVNQLDLSQKTASGLYNFIFKTSDGLTSIAKVNLL